MFDQLPLRLSRSFTFSVSRFQSDSQPCGQTLIRSIIEPANLQLVVLFESEDFPAENEMINFDVFL